MPTIQRILFPYDFSPAAEHAVPYLRALATRLGAKVTLFSVVPPAWTEPPALIAPRVGVDPEEFRREIQLRLDEALTTELAGLNVERITALGDPAVKITAFAQDNRVDLVMMPTHGMGLFRSLLLGSVTSKVLHDAHSAVWTAAHAEKQHAREFPQNILCALDGSERSLALAQWAVDFSRQMGATLQLLHVVRPVSDWLSLDVERTLQEEARQESRKRIEEMMKSGGVQAPLRVAVGEIVAAVTEEARQEGADLIILGRGAIHASLGRLRTHARGIIQHSPCPVISV
ncbi:MAG TPA: universal stress protein [Bryobacteraceae bacterium]|nr:universal stress protein [Bryobacteraceae bacterium]